MTASWARITLTRRAVLVALCVVVLCVAWAFAFYFPQTRKLGTLDRQRTSLEATVAADQARLQELGKEARHVPQMRAMYDQLEGYAPSTEDLYTYVRTISGAAKAAGVKITSLEPGSLSAVTGTGYSAVPITVAVKGTYDHLLAFVEHLYDLPRLTDLNALTVTGGGPGTSRSTMLSASLQLAIFTTHSPTAAAP
jgi:Tfp pilus assembly protein PilO